MSDTEQGKIYMSADARAHVFATGIGVIEPTGEHSVAEVIEASDASQKPIGDAAVVCVDGRHSAAGKQPVREKVAGGNLCTFTYAAVAANWSLLTDETKAAGPDAVAEAAAAFLVKAGEKLGAHEGNCGALLQAAPTTEACAVHANDDVWTSQAQRDLGANYNPAHWQRVQEGYATVADDEQWRKWEATTAIPQKVAAYGGVVEKLDGTTTRPELDPENKRHGHFEEATRVHTTAGMSNDRDNAVILTFQVDVDPMVRMAQKAAKDEEECSLLLHAMVMRQYGTLFVLAKNQPIFS